MLSERFEMRFSADLLKQVDDWRRQQPDLPARAEAIRRLIESGLSKAPAVTPSSGSDPGPTPRGKLGPSRVPRARKPAPERKAEPAAPRSKLEQIRALREQGAR
jgi:hypothetical protein